MFHWPMVNIFEVSLFQLTWFGGKHFFIPRFFLFLLLLFFFNLQKWEVDGICVIYCPYSAKQKSRQHYEFVFVSLTHSILPCPPFFFLNRCLFRTGLSSQQN